MPASGASAVLLCIGKVVKYAQSYQPHRDSPIHTDVNDSLLGRGLSGMPVLPELELLCRDLLVVKNNHHHTL